MSFVPDENNIHRVYDPDTGFSLQDAVRDVPFDKRQFILRLRDKMIFFYADFRVSDEKMTSYYVFRNDRLLNSFRSSMQIETIRNIGDFKEKLLPILREAVTVYDIAHTLPRSRARWTTDITFEI
jgi:hypothetical protein